MKRIAAAHKSWEILKFIADYQRCYKKPALPKEIAVSVGLPLGTCLCHLATAEDHAMVEKAPCLNGSGVQIGYIIGLGIADLLVTRRSHDEAQIKKHNENLQKLKGL